MHIQTSVLGNAFSDWSELTEEYMAGMDALRRREPGASARMMEIAKLMGQYHQVVSGEQLTTPVPQASREPAVSRTASWFKAATTSLFGPLSRSSLLH